MKDAELHAAEDRKKKDEADIKNRADQMVYETEKNLRDYGDRLDSDTKAKVESAVGRVKEALKTNNIDEIKSATEAVTTTWHEAAGKMYQHTTSSTQGQRTTADKEHSEGKNGREGEPVDADYEVVK